MKLCRGCNQSLPESSFTGNTRAPDGLDWRCRACKREQTLKYIRSDKGKLRRQMYYEANKSKGAARKREYRAKYATENPLKVRARWLLGNAVRKGYISRPTEKRTWKNNWEFHHPDHNRPYYGTWVSPSDHRLIDAGKKSCPPCVDHTSHVRERILAEWGLA